MALTCGDSIFVRFVRSQGGRRVGVVITQSSQLASMLRVVTADRHHRGLGGIPAVP